MACRLTIREWTAVAVLIAFVLWCSPGQWWA